VETDKHLVSKFEFMKTVSRHIEEFKKQYEESPFEAVVLHFVHISAILLPFETLAAIYFTYSIDYTPILFVPIVHGILVALLAIAEEDIEALIQKLTG
jgi:hypothetical protein